MIKDKKPTYPDMLEGDLQNLVSSVSKILHKDNNKQDSIRKHMIEYDESMRKMMEIDHYMTNSVSLSQDPLMIR